MDGVQHFGTEAMKAKGRAAKEKAIVKVQEAHKEQDEAGRLWAEHSKSHK
jgi:hypothetical protein